MLDAKKLSRLSRSIIFFLIDLIVCVLPASALAEGAVPPGDWAFEYDTQTPVLSLREDGTAAYQGTDCTWQTDGDFLILTMGTQRSVLRCSVMDGEPYIYLTTVYTRPEGEEGSLVGDWSGPDEGRSSFVFTATGYFMEDSAFSGTYSVDAENGTFCLMYGGMFADTTCYFSLEENRLTVEYPWHLVKTEG